MAIVVAIGITVTTVAFLTANRAEERRVVRVLELRVEWRVKDLRAKIGLVGEVLVTAIQAAAKPLIDVQEFYRFTSKAAAGSRSIAAIAWAVPVTRGQRAKFEAAAGWQILEPGTGTGASRSRAAERESYTPIVIQNRFDERLPSVGYDLSLEPIHRLAMMRACDSGLPKTVLTPDALPLSGPTYLTFLPVFDSDTVPGTSIDRRARLRGYIVGVFRVVDVLNGAIADTPEIPETLNFYLGGESNQEGADSSFPLVATYSPIDHAIKAAPVPALMSTADYTFVRSFDVRGQRWRVESFFSPEAVAAERSIGPQTILIAGLLLTAVLAAYVVSGIRRASTIRTLVGRRTLELRETNTKLEALIEASPLAIGCLDAEHRVILWNAGAEQLFGYTADEAMGRPYPLVLPHDRAELQSKFQRLAEGEVIRNAVSKRPHRDGSLIDTSASAAPFFDTAGGLAGIVFAIEDIRERTLVQNQLERYVDALERSNKELDDFAYIASHDLKEPLRGLITNARFLREDYAEKLGPEGSGRLQRLGDLGQRMEQLVDDLFYFSRLGRQELAVQPTDLNAVIRDIETMSETMLTEGDAVIVIPHALPQVRCDKTRIGEVFRNLITNAVKYNDNATKRVEVGYLDEVATKAGIERQVFYVKDDGIGIAEEFHEEIFRIFKRLNAEDDDKKGTGVGLTFVRKIIERHGGRIWLDSVPGEGSTFYFTIRQGQAYDAAA